MKHLSKMLKGLVAVFAAAAMALTLAPTAFAAETTPTTYKLTLNNTTTGHTYEAYQIFT
jgi:ABC-type sugar transport system substrate-binding protein